jgi:glycosyltransferase involved in cell wall biosynthesis
MNESNLPTTASDIDGTRASAKALPTNVPEAATALPHTALVHYWLLNMRGGEKVLEQILDMFPAADVYTHAYDPDRLSATFRKAAVTTTFIAQLPFAKRFYRHYLPLMPMALEAVDLSGYELVISSESGPAKGVLRSPDSLHICYCHSPMRYVWRLGGDTRAQGGLIGLLSQPLLHYLRQWDLATAARVDHFVANSRNTQRRIAALYRREAEVIYPPVDTRRFELAPEPEDFYLVIGELVQYKRVDLAIDAFRELDLPLVIIGDGGDRKQMMRRAGPRTTFLGKADDATVARHMARCRALIFPGEEDFGIVPVEVMASGRPVIAFGRGGALETVVPGRTGVLFNTQTMAGLVEAVREMEERHDRFVPADIQHHARTFDTAVFRERMRDFILIALERFRAQAKDGARTITR